MTDISPPRQASADTARSSGSRWDAPAGYQQLGTSPGSPDVLHADIEIYRSLIAALNEGIVLQRADGAILATNPSAERILGLTADQLAGRSSTDARWHAIRENGEPFPGEDHPAMRSLRTGQPYRDVVMGVQKPDGSQTWISINSQPLIRPGARSPHAVVATFTDITARKQTESQRELLLAEFEHALLRRGLLLRAVLDLARETSPDDVLLGVLHAAMHLVKGEQGGVTCWDEERQQLVTVASTIPGIEPGFTCGLGQGVTGQAAAQRRPVIFNAYQQEAEVTNPARSAGIMAAVAVPLLYDGKLIGAFGITTSATDQRFAADDAEDLQLLAAIAAAVLVGVERAQLQAIAAAARELAHLVNNDLALAVGTLDILREHDHVGADYQPMVEGALEQLQMAAQRLRQLGRITRFRTWESPAGPSLDLDASAE